MSAQERFVSSPLDEGLLVGRSTDDRLFLLNGSARFMWERLAEGSKETEIPALVASHYGISVPQARRDFRRTLRRWQAERLVRPVGRRHAYKIAGLAFEVEFHDAALADVLMPLLTHLSALPDAVLGRPPLEIEVAKRGGKIVFWANGIQVLRTADVGKLVEKLISYLFQYVSDKADWMVSMHAAAVATPRGCVLMPGASRAGKSSMTAALLSFGNMMYVSDDLALLAAPSLAVIPVPMPLVLKSGSWNVLKPFLPELADQATFQRFGQESRYWAPPRERVAGDAQPVRAVVFPRYQEGAVTVVTRISPLDAMSRITAAPAAVRPPITRLLIEELTSFARRVPAYALSYSTLGEACRVVQDLLLP